MPVTLPVMSADTTFFKEKGSLIKFVEIYQNCAKSLKPAKRKKSISCLRNTHNSQEMSFENVDLNLWLFYNVAVLMSVTAS
jgi:hypothetical protein